ncbi:MAG: four helix bundle protein [Bacteroidetes bacterium]|nr:four helix bundle protein [Bacteroidota bacterium]
MATIKQFEDLECWKLARQLSDLIFTLTEKGAFVKDFGFKNQIKDASGSVMDNIAEGFGRGGNREFVIFLGYAIGSANEVQSQLYRALDWKYISQVEFKENYELAETIIAKSGSLINYLNNSQHKGEKFKREK